MVVLAKLRCVPVDFAVWTAIFTVLAAKITAHIVKCTETQRNFSSTTINYPSAVSSVYTPVRARARVCVCVCVCAGILYSERLYFDYE